MRAIVCVVGLLLAGPAMALECCQRCGHACECCKTCRLVPSTKKVTKNVYHTECEDFCVPAHSAHEICRDECGRRQVVVTPRCGEVRTRKKLIKKEVTEEVPSTKCVVEYLCPACAAACQQGPSASLPAANQMSTGLAQENAPRPESGSPAAPHTTSEPRMVSAAKTEIQRLLSPWRK